MKSLKYYQVDVFTKKAFEGNPCAVYFDCDELKHEEMLSIAREMNLSETVFLKQSESCDFRAVYYTPREEIPLAGHPTIATAFSLIESGRVRVEKFPHRLTLELTAGKIVVDIDRDENEDLIFTMTQLKPEFLKKYGPEEVLPCFGLSVDDVIEGVPIQTVSTGTPMLMVPLNSIEKLKNCEMNVSLYRRLKEQGDFFSPHLFVLEGFSSRGNTFARHFGLPPDSFEDPFTGSASGAMAAYLWKYNLIERPVFTAEQGHLMSRPGMARLEVLGVRDDIECVKISGTAVKILEGKLGAHQTK